MSKTRREFLTACAQCTVFASVCFSLKAQTGDADFFDDDEIINIDQLSYCSADCHYCDAFNATQLNDNDLRKKAAKRWGMQPEEIHCNGCKSGPSLFPCEARTCAMEKGVKVCALCDLFPACDKAIWKAYPILRRSSEKLRQKLALQKPS